MVYPMSIEAREYGGGGSGTTLDKAKRQQLQRLRAVIVRGRCHSGGRGRRTNDEIGAKSSMKILHPETW